MDLRKSLHLAMLAAGSVCAADEGLLKNWFNDPFLQVRNALPGCPVPLGPLRTEAEMKSESHLRVERGTSCWLAGECKEPNAFRYDAAIGQEISRRFAESSVFRESSLWITVKGRFVWAEGCLADRKQVEALDAWLRSVPDVQRVIVNVTQGVAEKPPYPTAPQSR